MCYIIPEHMRSAEFMESFLEKNKEEVREFRGDFDSLKDKLLSGTKQERIQFLIDFGISRNQKLK